MVQMACQQVKMEVGGSVVMITFSTYWFVLLLNAYVTSYLNGTSVINVCVSVSAYSRQ